MAHRISVAVLGSTGSIGVSTLDVLARHRDRYRVAVLAARSNGTRIEQQCREHEPDWAVLTDPRAAAQLAASLSRAGMKTKVLAGIEVLEEMASHRDVDYVMAAIVGAAGLASTLAAARAGKRILLANKESLVMSGPLLMNAVREGGATLIPIDSEHNAIFQCLPPGQPAGHLVAGLRRILLTASGGPFLRTPIAELEQVTPEQACAHPRWVMGRKISVDSATLMNKGLELIEACLLFRLPPARVEVLVHPQSIVHSLVEFLDGSVLAQLGNPDMRVPIAHALGWPERLPSGVQFLDLAAAGRLDFELPDLERFPGLRLARAAAEAGGTAPAVLNAANEEAVAAFLAGHLRFPGIVNVIEQVLGEHSVSAVSKLEDVLGADGWARAQARQVLEAAAGEMA